MTEHFNRYHLKHFAGTIADCMEIELPSTMRRLLTGLLLFLKSAWAALLTGLCCITLML